jgi:hypothetical protein
VHPQRVESLDIAPTLVWGLLTRGLGVIYLIAFASLYRDVLGIAGSRGHTPIAPQLAAIARDFPSAARFVRFPTLLWLGASDRALRGWIVVGMIASAAVIVGIVSPLALAICWIVYLSFDLAMDMLYPWDCALYEAGFLALFLAPLELGSLHAVAAAPIPIAWAYRWLLFRIVFGFGKYKFFGPGTLHLDYLKSFMLSQPLSTPLGYRAFRVLPRWVFAAGLIALFAIEVVLPFFAFGTPEMRLIAAIGIAGLMITIQATGNFGFFNAIVLVLCIVLFDRTSITDARGDVLELAIAGLLLVAGLLSLPFNSWIAQSWTYWPSFDRVPVLRWVVRVLRALAPFRLVHAYGVFSPQSGPPVKWVPIVEGTRDGVRWERYRYRFMPSDPSSPPRFIAPRFPRFDHALIYDALGLSLSGFLGSTLAIQNPYRFSRVSWMERLMERLLEGSPDVRALFAHDPFGDVPPIAVRIRLFAFEPAEETYWNERLVHTHVPERRRDPSFWSRWLPTPELFHPDDRIFRERTSLRDRLARPEDERLSAILFDEVLPAIGDWTELERRARELEERFDLSALEPVLARWTLRVMEALRPEWRGDELHLYLYAHEVLLSGRHAVERALAGENIGPPDPMRGLLVTAVFRRETIASHCRKARLRQWTMRGAVHEPPKIAPGFLRILPSLAPLWIEPDERLPRYARTERGWELTAEGSRA